MERRFIGAMYHYEYSSDLKVELSNRGYYFTVKWDGFSPNGVEWMSRNGKVPTQREIKNEIADILKIDKSVIVSFAINMGVRETLDGEAYEQYVRNVTVITSSEID